MRVFYSAKYAGSKHVFDTTRKSRWVAESLIAEPLGGVQIAAPPPAKEDSLLRAHSADYIAAMRSGSPRVLAESQGLTWDYGLWDAARYASGGMISAALAALESGVSGSLSSGLHHARRDRGRGYCTFNGLAVASMEVLALGAARSVLIIDLDAHCGGGTSSIIEREERIYQVDVSVSAYDRYAATSNSELHIVQEPQSYLKRVRDSLEAVTKRFDLVLYNAGMDVHERCEIGGLTGVRTDMIMKRERLVFDWCRRLHVPVAFALAGGYVSSALRKRELVDLHLLTVRSATAC